MKKLFIIIFISLLIFSCKGKKKMNSQVSMIMLKSTSSITKDKMFDIIKKDWKDNLQIIDFEIKDKTILFKIDSIQFAVSEMPAPIPADELKFPIQTAYYWKNAENDISHQKYHLIIFATGKAEKIEISKKLTMLTASILKITDSIGVYWGDSSQVIQNKLFYDYSVLLKDNSFAIPVWIKVTGYQNEDSTFYLYTIGLSKYGHREFEIENFRSKLSEGMYFLMDFSSYVLQNGPVINDGDTVGGSEEEKIKVKYKKSSLRPDEDVISILF